MTLSAIVNGITYSLDDGTYCHWLGDDGFGMSPMHRLSERGPLQHGDTDRGYRLDPRIVRLVLAIDGTSQANLDLGRMALLSIFKPSNAPLTLRNIRDDGTYCLDCHYVGDMIMPSKDREGWYQTVVIALKANDPTWYGPSSESHIFSIGGGSDTMYVPTVIPMTIGASTIDVNTAIANNGTADAYPIIRITGSIKDPVIINNSTGDRLDFTGTTIAAAHYFDIDLRYGYKTVFDNHGINQIAALIDPNDIASFHLGARPDVPNGLNSITVTGTLATESTSISLVWQERFIGI